MASFQKLYEDSQSGRDFWFKPKNDPVNNEIIERGLEVRSDRTDGNTFWDDFIAVFSQNSEAAAKFFEIPRDRIAKWPQKINHALSAVRSKNEDDDNKKKKKFMMPTGL